MDIKNKQFLWQARMFIQENMDNSAFSATEFSELMHLSRSQLHRKLKALTGMNTTDFIRHYRLKLAAELLKEKNDSVTDIAYKTGFTNMSYFSKCFKAKYGCSPSKYVNKKQ